MVTFLRWFNMVTPAQRAKKYGELSYEEYALWYASEIGVTEGDIAAAGKMLTESVSSVQH